MAADWQSHLDRWLTAGVLDNPTAERIRIWERETSSSRGLRWPILLALGFGALLLGAGVLLFVSAHWDQLPSSQRMALVVLMVGVFHIAGAFTAGRFAALSIALHSTGTIALGAGIALAGQIFHLSAHWPSAILMWAAGAVITWAILRHWTQAALTAILIPYWMAGEWLVRSSSDFAPAAAGIVALCFTYLSARRGSHDSELRKALGWIGGIALLPAVCVMTLERHALINLRADWIAWLLAVIVPLALAGILRRRGALWNLAAVTWTVFLAMISSMRGDFILMYVWCALGAVGLAAWGIREGRPERINLGIAGFAITVLAFYFSSVMDKMGRSASLIGLGLLFLGGGWLLERTRRRLVGQIRREAL